MCVGNEIVCVENCVWKMILSVEKLCVEIEIVWEMKLCVENCVWKLCVENCVWKIVYGNCVWKLCVWKMKLCVELCVEIVGLTGV